MRKLSGIVTLLVFVSTLHGQLVQVKSEAGHLIGATEEYKPSNLVDNDLKTWWTPGEDYRTGQGTRVTLSFKKSVWVYGFRFHIGSHNPEYPGVGNVFPMNNRIDEAILVLRQGGDSVLVELKFPDWDKVFFVNTSDYGIRYPESATLIISKVRQGDRWNDLCISEFKPVFEFKHGANEELKPISYEYRYNEKVNRDSIEIRYVTTYSPSLPSPYFSSAKITLSRKGMPPVNFQFAKRYLYKDLDQLNSGLPVGAVFSEGPRVLFHESQNNWTVFKIEYRSVTENALTSSVFAVDGDGKMTMLKSVEPCLQIENEPELKLLSYGNRRYDFRRKKWTSIVLKPMKVIENAMVDQYLLLFNELPDSGANVILAHPLTGTQLAAFRTDCFIGNSVQCAQWDYDEDAKRVVVYSAKEKKAYFLRLESPYDLHTQSWDGVSKVDPE